MFFVILKYGSTYFYWQYLLPFLLQRSWTLTRNLTPHTVNVIAEDGTIKATFPSEGSARADQIETRVGELDGIELVSMKFGATENLPAPAEGVYYIVSVITANAAKEEGRSTDDIVITADPVRDDSGRIIGCKRFALV